MGDALSLEIVAPTGVNTRAPMAQLPSKGKLIIGSHQDRASFVVEGQGVAEVHCAIGRIKGGGWALKDLGSEFGTRVNGKRVDSARLSAGDEILIGSRKLRVFDPAAPAGSASPSATGAAATERTPAAGTAATRRPAAVRSDEPASGSAVPQKAGSQKAGSQKAGSTGAGPTAKMPRVASNAGQALELAGYRIERPLGKGAMGDVFLATQTSLDRKVALKILKRGLSQDSTFVDRFRSEARSAARLNHPNVVTVFDVGEDQGRHFLSMEYMDGASVEARLQNGGPLPWRDALDVLRDAAAGLVYAESIGIVHRDIKPENLMRNRDGVTKIADLGLATQVEQEALDAGQGKVLGTPHFIAPEVVRGEPADARSDMYSLGATGYRILSGRSPFEGASTRDILRSALSEDPAPLGTLVPGLPAGLVTAIHRLLSKSPADRYPSASILLQEIERLRATDGREAGSPGSGVGSSASPGRGLKWALIAGGALAAGVALSVLGGGKDQGADDGFDGFPKRGIGGETTVASGGGTATPKGSDGATPDGPVDGENGATGAGLGAVSAGSGQPGDPDSTSNSRGGSDPDSSSGSSEADFEYRARLAYLELGDEALSSEDRAARLRALSTSYAGTDIAAQAMSEAETLESGVIEAERRSELLELQRKQALDALRAAAELDASPFHPGTALRAMRLVPIDEATALDVEFRDAARGVVDEVLQKGMQRGREAVAAADASQAEGDFRRTQDALRGFIGATDLPSAEEAPLLVGEGAPTSLAEFKALAAEVRQRLDAMEGREAEFDADRKQRERVEVGRVLGRRFEGSLRRFELEAAAQGISDAAELVSAEALTRDLRSASADLRLAHEALNVLLGAWDTPGWRRRSITDPRPGAEGSVDVVGVADDALLIAGSGAPERLALTLWGTRTAALRNLFLGRIDRDWNANERRGIAALLTVSATLETLDALAPALGMASTRIRSDAADVADRAFGEALEWADGDESIVGMIKEHRRAARQLTSAIVARENSEWSTSAEMLHRLIEEQRATWIVMMLSDGGKR